MKFDLRCRTLLTGEDKGNNEQRDRGNKKSRPRISRACFSLCGPGLKLYYVGCLGAFGRVDNVERHVLPFGQGLKAAVLNG